MTPPCLAGCADFYQQAFATDPAAKDFLQGAGLDHADAATVHQLGFANRTLGTCLMSTPAGRTFRIRLQTLGVLRQTTGHEHLDGCPYSL